MSGIIVVVENLVLFVAVSNLCTAVTNVEGTLPSEIGLLTSLTYLNLRE